MDPAPIRIHVEYSDLSGLSSDAYRNALKEAVNLTQLVIQRYMQVGVHAARYNIACMHACSGLKPDAAVDDVMEPMLRPSS